MASVPIILNEEQTIRLYKILLPSAIEIVKRRNAEQAQKEVTEQSARECWDDVLKIAQ